MIKVYIGKILDGVSYLPFLKPNLGGWTKESRPFFDKAVREMLEPIFEITEDYNFAEFLMVPHDFFAIEKNIEYLGSFLKISEKTNKKILIFDMSDFDRDINIPNSIIFRMAQYRDKLKDNEIIMPAIIGDVWKEEKMLPRAKATRPIVGFCGWGEIGGLKQKVKFLLKNAFKKAPFRQGIFFRKKAVGIIKKSLLVDKNILVRTFYSGHKNTLSISPEQARREFLNNLNNSDLSLSIKGDGNYSVRFYEILSAGRVPVFIDTNCVLPLEGLVNYKDFMLKINYKDIDKLDKIISDFWVNLSQENFIKMQEASRVAYENYFKLEKFFPIIFENIKNKK